MDRIYPSFLCLLLLQTSVLANNLCTFSPSVQFAENNKVGAVVATITTQAGVQLNLSSENSDDLPFGLEGNHLIATVELDFETMDSMFEVKFLCTLGDRKVDYEILIILENINDNHPKFDQKLYPASINEMSPVGATVGRFAATDADRDVLYYRLTTESSYFKLKLPTNPEILVNAHLDYERIREVELVLEAQDTTFGSSSGEASFTATSTILVSILDVDNRPPWYQPCRKHEVGGAVVCENAGYTGRVDLNEQETGVLTLKPGPLYAIDGDSGINEAITYSFLTGNGTDLFEINPNTGNITMKKPADVLGPISLTVLAAQRTNAYQLATTTLTISVQVKSLHVPQFQRPLYEALITSKGSMAVDLKSSQALQILATDEDYSSTGGLNPHITYSVEDSSVFSIIGGYLFLTEDASDGTLSLKVLAKDTSNDETATAQLRVELKLSSSTTTLPLSTTDIMTTSVGESTTNIKTTVITTNPCMSTGISTTSHSVTKISSGGFGGSDMAALGATLGVLLFVSLVVIGLLVYRMQKGKADWKKIQEVTMFRSSLGQNSGGQKEGIQYTNEAFQRDDDRGSMGSGGPDEADTGRFPPNTDWNNPFKEVQQRSSAPLPSLQSDGISDNGSDKTDDEKDVKPILTKERRVEEGYKSVWFKEDIDPNAKEEVVIIPDSREEGSKYEDNEPSSSSKVRNEDDSFQKKAPKVAFADTDLDSGLGVKMEDPEEDSASDHNLNIDL
ncbi:cadherin-related family member 5 isoform X1 [Kryptolebias marmoratus]|uniref:Cadherin-related family member 5-like n=1 Tax=Kryptolebias marmoratus TaxID=37003 RepID=A0A3Q3A9Z3_KRYMA|nr:cadherin-related family member 5 isoform X1 [Kryptolebias marmoratus]